MHWENRQALSLEFLEGHWSWRHVTWTSPLYHKLCYFKESQYRRNKFNFCLITVDNEPDDHCVQGLHQCGRDRDRVLICVFIL